MEIENLGLLKQYDVFVRQLRSGFLVARDVRSMFDLIRAGEPVVRAELGALTYDDLKSRYAISLPNSAAKTELVNDAYCEIMKTFVLGQVIRYSPIDKESYFHAVACIVSWLEDSDVQKYARQAKEEDDAAIAFLEQAKAGILAIAEAHQILDGEYGRYMPEAFRSMLSRYLLAAEGGGCTDLLDFLPEVRKVRAEEKARIQEEGARQERFFQNRALEIANSKTIQQVQQGLYQAQSALSATAQSRARLIGSLSTASAQSQRRAQSVKTREAQYEQCRILERALVILEERTQGAQPQ